MTTATQIENLVLLAGARQAVSNGAAAAIRKAAGLSQHEVAEAVGVSQTALSRWERGERRPTGEPGMAYGLLLDRLLEQLAAPPADREAA